MRQRWNRFLRRNRWVAPTLSCLIAGGSLLAQDSATPPSSPATQAIDIADEGRVRIQNDAAQWPKGIPSETPGGYYPGPEVMAPPYGPFEGYAPGSDYCPPGGYCPPSGLDPYASGGAYGDDSPYNLSTEFTPSRPSHLRVPNMIGDALGSFGTATISATNSAADAFDPGLTNPTSAFPEQVNAIFDLPVTTRIPKIAENNSPIPQDRVYFGYNHFHSAYDFRTTVTGQFLVPGDPTLDPMDPLFNDNNQIGTRNESRNLHQDRFTLGLEKTFFHGDMSVEFRLPLVTQVDYSTPSIADPTMTAISTSTNDPTGDFQINLKQVFADFYTPKLAGVATWGVGFTFPTGDGATTKLYEGEARFQVDDTAYHFSPFVGFVLTRPNCWFFQGFFQADFTNDGIKVFDSVLADVGEYKAPHLGHIDLGVGYWLVNAPHRKFIQGIAPMAEYHFTSRMRDIAPLTFNANDPAVLPDGTPTPSTVMSTVLIETRNANRDIHNVTTGVHVTVTDWMNFRTAGVFPLKDEPNRDFDAEFVFQLDLTR
ncbi:MAG: hypothetical protein KDA80_17155 [Planctomycetaceae bacterium]|nr:hypothetical protein [Planctomycetaceae bacterium]